MNQETHIPFAEIVSEISRLCNERQTGTLFISTRANRSVQIMLQDGNIVYVYFFNKRGREALALMKEIKGGRFRFQEGAVIARPMDLPSTSEILQDLLTLADQKWEGADRSTASAGASAMPSGGGGGLGLTSAQQNVLEQALVAFIGPMASIICEEVFETAGDLASAVESMAGEIPSQEQAARFRQEVLQKLGK